MKRETIKRKKYVHAIEKILNELGDKRAVKTQEVFTKILFMEHEEGDVSLDILKDKYQRHLELKRIESWFYYTFIHQSSKSHYPGLVRHEGLIQVSRTKNYAEFLGAQKTGILIGMADNRNARNLLANVMVEQITGKKPKDAYLIIKGKTRRKIDNLIEKHGDIPLGYLIGTGASND